MALYVVSLPMQFSFMQRSLLSYVFHYSTVTRDQSCVLLSWGRRTARFLGVATTTRTEYPNRTRQAWRRTVSHSALMYVGPAVIQDLPSGAGLRVKIPAWPQHHLLCPTCCALRQVYFSLTDRERSELCMGVSYGSLWWLIRISDVSL